jgi:Fe-S cluster assembly iron-binding protein IscA
MLKNIIKLTPNAIKQFNSIFKNKNNLNKNTIKLSLKSKGCSGLVYSLDFTDNDNDNDKIINHKNNKNNKDNDEIIQLENNKKLIIDSKSLLYLIGTEIDYKNNDIESYFIFKNPNEKGSCGCGKSVKI